MPRFPEPEFRDAYTAYTADPTPAATDAYLGAIAPVLNSGLRAYGGPQASPALRSQAKVIALDATRTYDPTRGPLSAHLRKHLQGLRRYNLRQRRMVAVPEAVLYDHKAFADAQRELEDELGRVASDREISDRTGLSLRRIASIRNYRPGYNPGALEALQASRSDDDDWNEPAVRLGDATRARIDFLYDDFDPIDQAIVDHHYGLRGRRPTARSALARKLNLSPAALSRRAERIARMLDELGEGVLPGG